MLSGSFVVFPLAEILGLVARARTTGALAVASRDLDGTLFFREGQLCAAEIGDLSGPVESEAALDVRLLETCVAMLRAPDATFEFRADVPPTWPTPWAVPVERILDEAIAIAEDWPRIMTTLQSFDRVLERTGTIAEAEITLTATAFRFLELVDGRSSIRDLARRLGISLVVLAPQVRSLVQAGAVRPASDGVVDLGDVEPAVEVAAAPVAPPPDPPPAPDPVAPAPAPLVVDPAPAAPEPAPEPVAAAPAPEPEERAQIVVDRSELLRMFSGLKDG